MLYSILYIFYIFIFKLKLLYFFYFQCVPAGRDIFTGGQYNKGDIYFLIFPLLHIMLILEIINNQSKIN